MSYYSEPNKHVRDKVKSSIRLIRLDYAAKKI